MVVGFSRSGTTFVSELLHLAPETVLASEPHLLWKSEAIASISDDQYVLSPKVVERIRYKFARIAGDSTLIEKSPPNSLRPFLVYSVFPRARVILVKRDPARIIASNVAQSLWQGHARWSLYWQKYVRTPTRSPAVGVHTYAQQFAENLAVKSTIPLMSQIRISDLNKVAMLFIKLAFARRFGPLPFGPRPSYWRSAGYTEDQLIEYYARIVRDCEARHFEIYARLFGRRLLSVNLEDIQDSKDQLASLFQHCGLNPDRELVTAVVDSIPKHIRESTRTDDTLVFKAREVLARWSESKGTFDSLEP